MLESKLAEAKSKKDTLKARSASAKTSKQIQEMIGSLDTSSSVAAFDKMEEKVREEHRASSSRVLLCCASKSKSKSKLTFCFDGLTASEIMPAARNTLN